MRGLWFLSEDRIKVEHEAMLYISVPLRGLWFLSLPQQYIHHRKHKEISVPLRGLWFLSLISHGAYPKFEDKISVPLRGLWFLSPEGHPDAPRPAGERFPSPCGDYGSYLISSLYSSTQVPANFRPLAGIMVLINFTTMEIAQRIFISVPLRGLWFLSGKEDTNVICGD